MPNTAEFEGKTARVNLVGPHNQFADRTSRRFRLKRKSCLRMTQGYVLSNVIRKGAGLPVPFFKSRGRTISAKQEQHRKTVASH